MDYKKASGERIAKVRLSRGWDTVKLAAETGLAYNRIDHYEKGRRQVPPAEVVKIAKALGTKPGYLMALDDSDLQLTPTEEALIKNWRTLSEKDRMRHYRALEIDAMQNRDPAAPKATPEPATPQKSKRARF